MSIELDDALGAEVDAIAELSCGKLDRAATLLAAARLGLPELRRQAELHAARSVRRCPRCGHVGLAPRDEGGVLFQACIECGGVWLDTASLQKLLVAPAPEIVVLARTVDDNARSARDVTPALACPVCGEPLVRRHQASSGIRLDSCERHGTWFDRTELGRFTNVFAKWQRSRAELEAAAAAVGGGELHTFLGALRGGRSSS